MNKILTYVTRSTGKGLLILLAIFQIFIYLDYEYAKLLTLISIGLILLSIVLMSVKVNKMEIQQKIASSVTRMTQLILKVDTKEELYQMVLEEIIKNVSGAEKGSMITIDEHGDVRFESVVGFDLEAAQSMSMKLEDTFLFKAIDGEMPKSIVVTDIAKKNESVVAKNDTNIMHRIGVQNVKATICVPITLDKQLFGMINIDSESVNQFNREDIELIELFSDEVSKVVKLYTLFEKTIIDSKYDGLTGLYNRSTFKQRIHRLKDEEYIVVYFDLDSLKVVNDTYGHDIGDLYLNHFVEGINKQILGKEIFSRFGGDEFVLCFCRSKDTYKSFISQCERWFKNYPLEYNNEVLKVDYSFGEAYYKTDSEDIDELIKIADRRMYDHKLSKKEVSM